MKLTNDTPLPSFASPNDGPDDRPVVTLVLKGTFDIVNGGRASLADEQSPIAFADETGETPLGPLPRLDSDVAPFKPRADVLMVGARAYAPEGSQASECDVRLRVGRTQKIVRVFGSRLWESGGFARDPRISKPEPFTPCDLTWTEAYGGVDAEKGGVSTANPVGKGMVFEKVKKKEVPGYALPRIEDPEHLIASWTDRPPPAGFGTVGRGWEPRVGFLGTYDEVWETKRAPRLPKDFSFSFHNAAPADLQVDGYLKGDETFTMVNATEDGRLSGQLPAERPVVTLRRAGANREETVTLNLDTLVLFPEERKLHLLWRATMPIAALEDPGIAEIEVKLRRP